MPVTGGDANTTPSSGASWSIVVQGAAPWVQAQLTRHAQHCDTSTQHISQLTTMCWLPTGEGGSGDAMRTYALGVLSASNLHQHESYLVLSIPGANG